MKLDFHTLQASQKMFVEEYERVKEMVNRSIASRRIPHFSDELEAEEPSFEVNAIDSRLVKSQKMPKLSLNVQSPGDNTF